MSRYRDRELPLQKHNLLTSGQYLAYQ